jgi:hypothetical protein
MDLTELLSNATMRRLRRIMELKKCNEQSALDFAINLAWVHAENKADLQTRARQIELKNVAKESFNPNDV